MSELVRAARRGVRIRINNDRSQSAGKADKAALQALVNADVGIQVKVTESTKGAIDHLKMMILDGEDGADADVSSVLLGSYNFSASAQKQDNFVTWTNDPGQVAQAMTKFDDDWRLNKCLPEWQLTKK